MVNEHVDKCFDKLLKHLQEMRNVEKSIRKGKKKSQSKKDQSKKTSGARQVQSHGGLNRVSSFTFHYRT